ncbi:hypothetical protein H6504_02970 [Candidatus Woesearchaeota archaeon]|nr:hypothetical protein [Candidatus Woesearchaeota archaeon]
MITLGNTDGLKKKIQQKYAADLREYNKEIDSQIAQMQTEQEKMLDTLKRRHKADLDQLSENTYAKVKSELTLQAKKDFEQARDALLQEVIAQAKADAKRLTSSKEYKDFVQAKTEGLKITKTEADDDSYGLPHTTVVKGSTGVKVYTAEAVYDLTVENLMELQKDRIRSIVYKAIM